MTWTPGALLELRTERFVLRTMTREDVDERYLGWLADPDVMVGLNLPRRKLSRLQAVQYVLSHDNRTKFKLLTTLAGTGEAIGFFTITVEPMHRTAETAVVVGERAHWGQNVVVEARSAILDFLFDTLEMHKVIGRPHGRNFSSIFNYKALGFQCEAVLREQMRAVEGEGRLDQMIFGILREEWAARRAGTTP